MSSSSKDQLAEGVRTLFEKAKEVLNLDGEEGLLRCLEFNDLFVRFSAGLTPEEFEIEIQALVGCINLGRSSLSEKSEFETDSDSLRFDRIDPSKQEVLGVKRNPCPESPW